MRKIKSIDVVFENCESYTIPKECIENLNVEGFNNRFYICGNKGDCSKYNRAYSFKMSLNYLSEIKKHYDFSEPFEKRVKQYDDITSIRFNYENGKKFEFYVPWNYENEQNNTYQKVKTKNNLLIIDIRKIKTTCDQI